MADATGKPFYYTVYWYHKSTGAKRSPVTLIEGYTTEADIPNILAIAKFGGDRSEAKNIEILSVFPR